MKFHVALKVKKLESTKTEYAVLFGKEPDVGPYITEHGKTSPGYMWKFDDLWFCIIEKNKNELDHLGFIFETKEEKEQSSQWSKLGKQYSRINGVEWEIHSDEEFINEIQTKRN